MFPRVEGVIRFRGKLFSSDLDHSEEIREGLSKNDTSIVANRWRNDITKACYYFSCKLMV